MTEKKQDKIRIEYEGVGIHIHCDIRVGRHEHITIYANNVESNGLAKIAIDAIERELQNR